MPKRELGTYVQALRAEFPTDTIECTQGYGDYVHVLIVSSKLNGKSELEKQAYTTEIIKTKLGEEAAAAVSMVVGYGTDELR